MAFGRRVVVSVDEAGNVTTTTEAVGGLKLATDPITTLIDPDVALTGTAKYVQLGMAALAGNLLGVKAKTGDWGVAVTDSLSFNIGGGTPRI